MVSLYDPAPLSWMLGFLIFGPITLCTVCLVVSGLQYAYEFNGEHVILRGRFGRIRRKISLLDETRAVFAYETHKTRNGTFKKVYLNIRTETEGMSIPVKKQLKQDMISLGLPSSSVIALNEYIK